VKSGGGQLPSSDFGVASAVYGQGATSPVTSVSGPISAVNPSDSGVGGPTSSLVSTDFVVEAPTSSLLFSDFGVEAPTSSLVSSDFGVGEPTSSTFTNDFVIRHNPPRLKRKRLSNNWFVKPLTKCHCFCRTVDKKKAMLECEECLKWYHFECPEPGLTETFLNVSFKSSEIVFYCGLNGCNDGLTFSSTNSDDVTSLIAMKNIKFVSNVCDSSESHTLHK